MASVHDVAAAVLAKMGGMPAMKLQKLVYYAQAWHLVWDDEPLFDEPIQAWANGPVAPALYQKHRGRFSVSDWVWGNPDRLPENQRETVDVICDAYGKQTAQWLSDLTHREAPWRDAREGMAPGQRGTREITQAAMAEYYGALEDDDAQEL